MLGKWEHIHALHPLHAIAAARKGGEIARERFGVAGNVDHAFGRKGEQALQKCPTASCARRVGDDYVSALTPLGKLLHELTCVGGIEARVRNAVSLGVRLGILHRVAVYLDTDQLLRIFCHRQPDRARAAVGVDHALIARKGGKLARLAVEDLGLHGIDLIERPRADLKSQSAERVGDVALSAEHFALTAEKKGRVGGVDIPHHRCDLGVTAAKLVHKGAAGGEVALRGDENDHELARMIAASHEDVAKKASPRGEVVGLYLEGRAESADGLHDPVGAFILEHTGFCRYDATAGRLVDARDHPSVLHGERRLRLVAVVGGLIHADDLIYMLEPPEQANELCLL